MMKKLKLSAGLVSVGLLFGASAFAIGVDATPHWVGTWACAPVALPAKLAADSGPKDDITVRDVVHVSLGGSVIRLRISNEFGSSPLKVGPVNVAMSAAPDAPSLNNKPSPGGSAQDATVAGSDHAVTFAGAADATIPAGKALWSDPVKMTVPEFAYLAVSIYIPKQHGVDLTIHATALSTNFTAPGDQTTAATLTKPLKLKSWAFLTGIDVDAPKDAAAVVTLGDSITDGMRSTVDGNLRWPDDLARRLYANPTTKDFSVLNAGISGGRILYPQAGPSMLERLDRDVFAQDGAKYLIVFAGINDINHSVNRPDPTQKESAQDMINGLKQIITRAHAHGMKVFGATITPEGASTFYHPANEQLRQTVNAFIRSPGSGYDGWFDFDKAVRDPKDPTTNATEYSSPDHVHLPDGGYQALADSIDLSKFK